MVKAGSRDTASVHKPKRAEANQPAYASSLLACGGIAGRGDASRVETSTYAKRIAVRVHTSNVSQYENARGPSINDDNDRTASPHNARRVEVLTERSYK